MNRKCRISNAKNQNYITKLKNNACTKTTLIERYRSFEQSETCYKNLIEIYNTIRFVILSLINSNYLYHANKKQ